MIYILLKIWFIISIFNYVIMLPDENKKNMVFKDFIIFILASPIITIIFLFFFIKKIL